MGPVCCKPDGLKKPHLQGNGRRRMELSLIRAARGDWWKLGDCLGLVCWFSWTRLPCLGVTNSYIPFGIHLKSTERLKSVSSHSGELCSDQLLTEQVGCSGNSVGKSLPLATSKGRLNIATAWAAAAAFFKICICYNQGRQSGNCCYFPWMLCSSPVM